MFVAIRLLISLVHTPDSKNKNVAPQDLGNYFQGHFRARSKEIA